MAETAAMAGFEALPDEAMLSIFSDLNDAKFVALCAPVCRRWRALVRYVDNLCFTMPEPTQKAVNAISSMLSRSHGVRSLSIVTGKSDSYELTAEDIYRWIEIVRDSIESLDVPVSGMRCPDLWVHLQKCPKLSRLRVYGGIGLFFPTLNHDMTNLRECIVDDTGIQFHALESIMRHCPMLEKLVVKKFLSFKVKLLNSSVKEVYFQGVDCSPFIMLETVNLKYLTLDSIGCVLYAPKLLQLHLPSRCKDLIVVSLDNLALLSMNGDGWEFEEIHSIVGLASNISELRIQASVTDPKPIVWQTFFQPLKNLETLSLGGNLLECFCKEVDINVLSELKLVKATIFLREGCFKLIEAMLNHCSSLKVIVVNCSDFIDISKEKPTTPMELFKSQNPELCNDLVELQSSHSRVLVSFG